MPGYTYLANAPVRNDSMKGVFSVSSCISENFFDYIDEWKHNGYWLFDSPQIMEEIAEENDIDLAPMTLFYYEVYEFEFNETTNQWTEFSPEKSFKTDIQLPMTKQLQGFDVVTFWCGSSPECSPLSCNGLYEKTALNKLVNEHFLFNSFDDAKSALDTGLFVNCEPGPYRIFAVYTVQ